MKTQQTTGYSRDQFPAMAKTLRKSAPATPAQAPQTSHSPLPWQKVYSFCGLVTDADYKLVIKAETSEANAAFIVRACNEYETLKSDHEKLSRLAATELKKRMDAEAHAQRLADALKPFAELLEYPYEYSDVMVNSVVQVEDIQAAVRELAQWEKDKQ